ncbi:MAG TPA: hypothetical protein DCE75_10945 [Acidimicrobiaceae bacterium]|nr:hypothetical protein [Acidimicrobiaceae bacterium]
MLEQVSRQQQWRRLAVSVGDSVKEPMERGESDLVTCASRPVLGELLDHPPGFAKERARNVGEALVGQFVLDRIREVLHEHGLKVFRLCQR